MAKTIAEEVLKNFAIELTEGIKGKASGSGENEEIVLLNEIKERLGECKLINDPKFFYWCYKYNRIPMSLYGFDFDEFDNSVALFVGDFGEAYHTILQESAQQMTNRALNFIRVAIQGNKEFKQVLENEVFDLYDQLIQFNKSTLGLKKIKVIIVSNGKRSSRARVALEPILTNIDVELFYWDIEWIYSNCNSDIVAEEVSIDAHSEEYKDLMGEGLPFLAVPQMANQFECYQCVVSGKLLAYVYKKYGSTLLEGNVRSFLTTKTAVNKKIHGTIINEPEKFYVYNNGIAAVAANIEIENGRITKIDKIQIVNGGQTTASLTYASQKNDADLTKITVPMKLTVIKANSAQDKEELDALIQKISETSNSQNKVSEVDFFANHPFHIKIKNFSNTIYQPGTRNATKWFYERTRSEYAQSLVFKTEAQKNSFMAIFPKEKKVTKQEFAKYYNLMKKQPDQVSKGSDSNFKTVAGEILKQWNEDQSVYNDVFYKRVISVGAIYRALEPEITKKKLEWFGGSYRANVIVYSIAGMLWKIEKNGKRFELLNVWDKGVSEGLKQSLLKLCHSVYNILTDSRRPVENVTQYCKKKECWENVKKGLECYTFEEQFIRFYLVSPDEYNRATRGAKIEQGINDEAVEYSKILSKPYKNTWASLETYLHRNRNLFPEITEWKIERIHAIAQLDSGKMVKKIPSVDDCRNALACWESAWQMGWKPQK